MNKYFICCEKCFKVIGKKNTTAARLWMDLCTIYLEHRKVIETPASYVKELRILENLGYILTTDQDETILIKVLGHLVSQSGVHCFCTQEDHYEEI